MTERTCDLHGKHSPANLSVEEHHLVPVAWQVLVPWPEDPPHPGEGPAPGVKLWDARTIVCCPTGHRNIHHWIVVMMRQVAELGPETEDHVRHDAVAAWGMLDAATHRLKEAKFALEGLKAMHGYGSLRVLAAVNELGDR